jgi:hypothetical protein
MFSEEGIFVWAIPPLLPHSSDYFLNDNPAHLPPLFRIPFPDDFVCLDNVDWMTLSSWYSGYRESIYFGIAHSNSKFDRFKLVVKPDLSDASLHVINFSELPLYNFQNRSFQNSYRICEDTFVSFWRSYSNIHKCGVYTGLTSAYFLDDMGANHSLFGHGHCPLCPASGRFVYFTTNGKIGSGITIGIVVVDLI